MLQPERGLVSNGSVRPNPLYITCERAGGVCSTTRRRKPFVGPRADEVDRLVRDVGKDADVGLAIGKAPMLDRTQLPPAGFG